MSKQTCRMWRSALMMGGLLFVAMVAVVLSDVIRTFAHMLDLSFLRDAGGNVPGMAGGVGAAGAGVASRQEPDWQGLAQDQAEDRERHPQATPADTPPSEVETAQEKIWKGIWTGGGKAQR